MEVPCPWDEDVEEESAAVARLYSNVVGDLKEFGDAEVRYNINLNHGFK